MGLTGLRVPKVPGAAFRIGSVKLRLLERSRRGRSRLGRSVRGRSLLLLPLALLPLLAGCGGLKSLPIPVARHDVTIKVNTPTGIDRSTGMVERLPRVSDPHTVAEALLSTPLAAESGLEPEALLLQYLPYYPTDEIQAFAFRNARHGATHFQKVSLLLRAIYGRRVVSDFYEAGRTLTAHETLLQRRGNCFSFTNLFVASARALGLQAYYANATRGNSHIRVEAGHLVHEGHIVARVHTNLGTMTVDFYETTAWDQTFWYTPLTDREATGMYLNNLGWTAMRRHGDPMPYFRAATVIAPRLGAPWNNLAVVLKASGDRAGALEVLQQAAHAGVRSFAPYFNLGLMSLEDQDFATAEGQFKRAIVRYFDNPFAFYNLGVSYAHQGKIHRARLALRWALHLDRSMGAARSKLDRLKRPPLSGPGTLTIRTQ